MHVWQSAGADRSASRVANFGSSLGSDVGDGAIDDLPIQLRPVCCHTPDNHHRSAFNIHVPDVRVIRPSIAARPSCGGILKNTRSSSMDPTINRPMMASNQRATSVTTVAARMRSPFNACLSPVEFGTKVSNPDACRPTPLMTVERQVRRGTSPAVPCLHACPIVKVSHSFTERTTPVMAHNPCGTSSCPCTPVHHTHTEVHHLTKTTVQRVERATSASDTRAWSTCASDGFRWPLRRVADLLFRRASAWNRRWPDVDGSQATLEHALCCCSVLRLMLGAVLILVAVAIHIVYKCHEEHWPTEFVQVLGLRHYGQPPV